MSTDYPEYALKDFLNIHDFVFKRLEMKKLVAKRINKKYYYKPNIYETAYRLDEYFDTLIGIILCWPNSNVTEICKKIDQNMKENEYRKTLRRIRLLVNLDLIEGVSENAIPIGNINKYSTPYKLTIHGIIYVILNYNITEIFKHDPLSCLLNNYPNNLIFEQFLYPYFTKNSLLKLTKFFPEFFPYLQEVCNQMLLSMYRHFNFTNNKFNALIDGKYLQKSIFYWPDSTSSYLHSKNINNTDSLKEYLLKEFKWEWIRNAKIKYDYENNKVDITDGRASAMILIPSFGDKVILRSNGKSYTNYFKILRSQPVSIVRRDGFVNNYLNNAFFFQSKKELLLLLYRLQFDCKKNKKIAEVLNSDPQYRKAIDVVINYIKIQE